MDNILHFCPFIQNDSQLLILCSFTQCNGILFIHREHNVSECHKSAWNINLSIKSGQEHSESIPLHQGPTPLILPEDAMMKILLKTILVPELVVDNSQNLKFEVNLPSSFS